MTQFEDLGDHLSPTLDLPVAGKVYRVPSPPARVGLRLQASWAVSAARRANRAAKQVHLAILSEDSGTTLEQDALGPVWDEMVADGVSIEQLNHAGMTAYLWVVAGADAARAWWVTPLGEASSPSPAPSTSTSTGEGNAATTGSSSGTTSRPSRSASSKRTKRA